MKHSYFLYLCLWFIFNYLAYMNKKLFLILIYSLITLYLHPQDADPVVFTINGIPTHKSEFLHAYRKSNENLEAKLSITEFLQSYTKLKMNVEEAKFLRLDTLSKYMDELEAYRSVIVEPYLTDNDSELAYVRKIYNRLTENIELNHFLIPFEQELILPSDTIAAYKKALEIRSRILKEGFKIEIAGVDSITKNIYLGMEGNNGYLGWIAPFVLSPQLEDAVYSAPLNEISMPVRTVNGYHIIQVLNKRKAIGSAEIEQVMFQFSRIPAPQQQIDSVRRVAEKEYNRIASDNDFQTLCDAFSEAYQTGDKGCYFGFVGLDSKFPPEFLTAVFNLEKPGDISKPVMSDYGFHIVRLLRKVEVPEFDRMQEQLFHKIKNSNRIYDLNKEKRKLILENVGISVNKKAYAQINNIASSLSPRDSLFTTLIENGDDILISIDNKRDVPVKEFSRYISYRQNLLKRNTNEIEMMNVTEASPYNLSTDILREYFNNFLNILALDYIESTIEDRYPEVKNIMNDFSEGLLVYEIKDRNIWNRSKTDETGLANHYAANKEKYRLDTPKYKGLIIHAKDEKSLQKARKIALKERTREGAVQKIRKNLNKKEILIKIEPGLWEKGENQYVDHSVYDGKEPKEHIGYPFFSVVGREISEAEEYSDVRTQVEADYQKYLDENWNSYLENKYKVNVNKAILDSIK